MLIKYNSNNRHLKIKNKKIKSKKNKKNTQIYKVNFKINTKIIDLCRILN